MSWLNWIQLLKVLLYVIGKIKDDDGDGIIDDIKEAVEDRKLD